MSPCFADPKHPLEMVLYDPAAASQQLANMRAQHEEAAKSSSSSSAGAMVPYEGSALDVAPINALPPLPPRGGSGREEPPCLRRHFLVALGLRADLPVHFIDDKYVTSTDLDAHQNRFRLPSDGVERRLRAILRPQELDAANLLHDPPRAPRKRPRQEQPEPPQNNGAAAAAEGEEHEQPPGKKMKKPKKKGKVHGGLRVKLVDLNAGAKELRMSRWVGQQPRHHRQGGRVPRLHPAVQLQGAGRRRHLGLRAAPVPPLRRGRVRRQPPAPTRRQQATECPVSLLPCPCAARASATSPPR